MSRGRSDAPWPSRSTRDHAVAARGEVFGQRPVHLLGEQQPVDEDQRPRRPPARFAVRPARAAAA